ncbi:MAG: cell wall-binding repeat-containing protein [Desulfosporosinus sp.]
MRKLAKLIALTTLCMFMVLTSFVSVQAAPIKPNVTRICGYDRFQTAISIAKEGFKDQKLQNVLIASGYSFPDALAASPLAMKLNASNRANKSVRRDGCCP